MLCIDYFLIFPFAGTIKLKDLIKLTYHVKKSLRAKPSIVLQWEWAVKPIKKSI
jgi:hypothetical protein